MIKWVSLFANVWIAEFYLKELWVDIVVANELLEKRCDLYNHFYPNSKIICWDITKDEIYYDILENALMQKCDFVIATPPCQWMSVAWKMKEDDPRNNLIIKAVNFIKDLEPNYAIIENVPTFFDTNIILNWKKITIKEYLIQELWEKYNLNMSILDASDYWTPQVRKRAITLISNKSVWIWEFPEKKEKITVREAIWYLPSLENNEYSNIKYHYAKKHSQNHVLWMKHTPTWKTAFENEKYFPQKENWERIKGFSTTYKRIDWDKPAPTITMCNWAISSQNNVHPWRLLKDWTYSDPRVLSLKEIFILTWLPDNIDFPTWATDNFIRQVIWEWIPPKLIKELVLNMPKINIKIDFKVYETKLNSLKIKNINYKKQETLFVNI
jgi:DNA (cytosine-5)-methyltransferase 1